MRNKIEDKIERINALAVALEARKTADKARRRAQEAKLDAINAKIDTIAARHMLRNFQQYFPHSSSIPTYTSKIQAKAVHGARKKPRKHAAVKRKPTRIVQKPQRPLIERILFSPRD